MLFKNNFSRNFKLFFQIIGVVAIVLTILPFIPVDHWSVRIFDFPHVQLTILTLFALISYFIKFDINKVEDYIFVLVLSACLLFQGIKIIPYTTLYDYEMHNASNDSSVSLSIYTANVLQENENLKLLIEDAERFNADVMLFTETNLKWVNSLTNEFDKDYPYKVEVPLENTYGMLLFSKLKLKNEKVKYMVEDTIPSIHTMLQLKSGNEIQVYAIHPAPPSPKHNPSSVDRDAELMMIAKESLKSKFPVVVMGDFNDVAWSETTSLFQKISGLLDLRKGRGFFSTFNAKSYIMRWPLDHIFASEEFRVLDVQLGSKTGSDHFPFFTRLSFEPKLASEQKLPVPTQEEVENAFRQINKETKQSDTD